MLKGLAMQLVVHAVQLVSLISTHILLTLAVRKRKYEVTDITSAYKISAFKNFHPFQSLVCRGIRTGAASAGKANDCTNTNFNKKGHFF